MKRYLRPQGGLLVLAVVFSLMSGGLAVAVQFTKGSLLDQALAGVNSATLRQAGLLLALIVFEILCYHLFDRARGRYFVRAKASLREDYFRAQLRKTPPEMMNEQLGDVLASYTDQIDLVGNNYLINLPLLYDVVLKIVLVSSALFLLDYRVALLTLVLLTTPLYVPKLIEKKLQNAQKASTAAFAEHLAKVSEWLNGFELIKNFGAQRRIMNLFAASNHKVCDTDYAMRKMSYLSRSLSAVLSYLSHFAILAFSAWLVLKGSFTAGSFFIAVGMIDQLSYPIISISVFLQEMIAARPVIRKILEQIDTAGVDNQIKLQPAMPLDVVFDRLSFAYPDREPVINNLNLRIREGEKCLVTGPSGGGKTTLMNLLLGYYVPCEGRVTLGGVSSHQAAGISDLLTIMRQDPVLFHDSLRNNLSLYQNIDDNRMIKMLKNLNLHRFASDEGLDSIVLENGSNLSGGERKRICLARTLLRGSPVIILDEPLANVDPDTAQQIASVVTELSDVTLFVISHQHNPQWPDTFEHHITVG